MTIPWYFRPCDLGVVVFIINLVNEKWGRGHSQTLEGSSREGTGIGQLCVAGGVRSDPGQEGPTADEGIPRAGSWRSTPGGSPSQPVEARWTRQAQTEGSMVGNM